MCYSFKPFPATFNDFVCSQNQFKLKRIIAGTTVWENEEQISHCWLSVHAELTQCAGSILELAYSDAKHSTDYTHYFLKPSRLCTPSPITMFWIKCLLFRSVRRGEGVRQTAHGVSFRIPPATGDELWMSSFYFQQGVTHIWSH